MSPMAYPNASIEQTVRLLADGSAGFRRQVYEGAISRGSNQGSGMFFVTGAGGENLTLSSADVNWLMRNGYIRQDPECRYLYDNLVFSRAAHAAEEPQA